MFFFKLDLQVLSCVLNGWVLRLYTSLGPRLLSSSEFVNRLKESLSKMFFLLLLHNLGCLVILAISLHIDSEIHVAKE